MSNSLDKAIKQYIIDRIDGSSYGQNLHFEADKVKFLHDAFYSEYGWAVPRLGEQKALKEWLSGLPSACNINFYNSDIVNLAIKWGALCENASKAKQQRIIGNWWTILAGKTGQLFRKHSSYKEI